MYHLEDLLSSWNCCKRHKSVGFIQQCPYVSVQDITGTRCVLVHFWHSSMEDHIELEICSINIKSLNSTQCSLTAVGSWITAFPLSQIICFYLPCALFCYLLWITGSYNLELHNVLLSDMCSVDGVAVIIMHAASFCDSLELKNFADLKLL